MRVSDRSREMVAGKKRESGPEVEHLNSSLGIGHADAVICQYAAEQATI